MEEIEYKLRRNNTVLVVNVSTFKASNSLNMSVKSVKF
jgi:hypothetical protein